MKWFLGLLTLAVLALASFISLKKGKKVLALVLALSLIGVAVAAKLLFPYQPQNPPLASDYGSTQAGQQKVIKANNQFALDFYLQLTRKNRDKNIFYSPYSIFSALAIAFEGARGETAAEIKSVFHFPDKQILRPNFAAIYNNLNQPNSAYEFRTGNALWVQKKFSLLDEYADVVSQYYAAKAANLDFAQNPQQASRIINNFIAEQTNNKIKELIPPSKLNKNTRLVITNAVYFKGIWQWQFDKANTYLGDFKVAADKIIQVPMMSMEPDKARFKYADLPQIQILELPYQGDRISMLILLPKKNLSSLETALTLKKLEQYKEQMKEEKLDAIYLPKFEFDLKYFLNENLKTLGMPIAFSPSFADFSGIDGKRDLYIDSVIHEAYIKVDEQGTEAAAATAVNEGITAVMPQKVFKADHPFIFIIQDKQTGNILFMGRVIDPSSKH